MTPPPVRRNEHIVRHRLVLLGSFLTSQIITAWILTGPLLHQNWWRGFRGYFANDQLSYAAIAVNAAKGNFSAVEPLTETGTSFYPSAWYLLLGILSNLTNQPVYRTWTLGGLTVIAMTMAFMGWLAYRFSGYALAPLLPAGALALGTLSSWTSGTWFTPLTSHAVVWGPFGTFFTLNAEAVGLAILVVAGGLLVGTVTNNLKPVTLLGAAVLLGVLANVQTYTFFTGVSFAVGFAASIAITRYPSHLRAAASIVFLLVVLAVGPWLVSWIGPIPLFGLVLLSGVPAVWPLIKHHIRQSLFVVSIFLIAASPQVVRTALGIINGDEFLGYRQTSTLDLGVPISTALISVLPLALIATFNAIVILRAPHSPERSACGALMVSLGVGAVVMASNDRWGFEQEPYRFWLQYSILTALLLSVITAWSIRNRLLLSPTWKSTTAVVGLIAIIIWMLSLADVRGFFMFASQQGIIAIEDERGQTLRQVLPKDAGLILSSRCLDPQILKLISGAPVVAFNRGLAWPDKRGEIDELLGPERTGESDLQILNTIGVTHIVTNSTCADDWQITDPRIQPVNVVTDNSGVVTVWRVP